MNPRIPEILKVFGLNASRIRKPQDAKLAQVYLVEDRYVLRSRPLETDTRARFAAECELYGQVAELTGFRFPQYERCESGACFVINEDCFWTLHKLIPGHPLGNWFELHRVDPSVNRQVLNALRQIHTTTTGCFDDKIIDRTRLLELVRPALAEAPDFLSDNALEQVRTAFSRVTRFCSSYPAQAGCFVHGDFHHGNILAHGGRIVGFIDLDWCRIGSPYEDLAFTLMMLLRDYENWSPTFRWPVYREMLDYYGFNGDAALLNDYLILYTLFDCLVFRYARFDDAEAFFEYQKQFMETVCRNLPSVQH
jgi:aminoglycoside phosphotransferase (APT) family kinase protein